MEQNSKNIAESDFVVLNVGGKLFTTTRGTLINKESDSVLVSFNLSINKQILNVKPHIQAAMFNLESNLAPGVKDRDGNYMIDRSGTYFEPILSNLDYS